MVKRLQGPSKPPPAPEKWAHDWHPYNDYLDVHVSHMRALIESGKVTRNRLSFVETRDDKRKQELLTVQVAGRIECAFDVLIVVDKWLEVRRGRHNRYEVRGHSYSYQAWLRNSHELVRYDTSHGIERLHCHRLDPETKQTSITQIALEDLPTLTDFIEEALGIAARLGSMTNETDA